MSQKILTFTAIIGIASITLITLLSVYHGLDGYNVMTAVITIGGLAGYTYTINRNPPKGT